MLDYGRGSSYICSLQAFVILAVNEIRLLPVDIISKYMDHSMFLMMYALSAIKPGHPCCFEIQITSGKDITLLSKCTWLDYQPTSSLLNKNSDWYGI